MKKRSWFGWVLAVSLSMSIGAWAAEKADQPVIFKSGGIEFTILKSDGETPVDGAKIKLSQSAKSKALAEAVADKDGKAVISLVAGKYFLKVEGRNISEMNVADDAAIKECRVILNDKKAGLIVAGGASAAAVGVGATAGTGAAVAAGTAAAVGAGTFTTIVVGGAAVMVAAGTGAAVYEHNKDDDDPVPEPTPTPTPTPTPRNRPSDR